jgi:plasmid maintenance system killer protein
MIELIYTAQFLRRYRKLDKRIQEDCIERLEEFRDPKNHVRLKVHKLRGKFKEAYSFSVNYKYRIVFSWNTKGESVYLWGIGDHSVYD